VRPAARWVRRARRGKIRVGLRPTGRFGRARAISPALFSGLFVPPTLGGRVVPPVEVDTTIPTERRDAAMVVENNVHQSVHHNGGMGTSKKGSLSNALVMVME